MAEDVNWASMAVEHDAEGGSVQRMPARNENSRTMGSGDAESLVDATSSGRCSSSGCLDPVG